MRTRLLVWILALMAVWTVTPAAGQKDPQKPALRPIGTLNVPALLDAYAAGRFDDALKAVQLAGDVVGQNLRAHWSVEGAQWIDADPAKVPQRALAAAAFVLETENLRIERGNWGVAADPECAGPCAMDWAQAQLVRRDPAGEAEHAWYLAASAMIGGVRDWLYLSRIPDPQRQPPGSPGLMVRALYRFPNDPRLLLEQALASAGRFSVTIDGARLTLEPSTAVIVNYGRSGQAFAGVPVTRRSAQEVAIDQLAALTNDSIVGAEASLRLGYLKWATGDEAEGRQALTQAAERTTDADQRYLARFLLGWIAMAAKDNDAAARELALALEARPDSQSAALALAALEQQRGDSTQAYARAQATLDTRPADADPWRLFLYGHHPLLKARIAALRAQVNER